MEVRVSAHRNEPHAQILSPHLISGPGIQTGLGLTAPVARCAPGGHSRDVRGAHIPKVSVSIEAVREASPPRGLADLG